MRFTGKIDRWDDARGFGFIAAQGNKNSTFVHIKAFTGASTRPQVGDSVSYEVATGNEGKSKAVNVRFVRQSNTTKCPNKPKSVHHRSPNSRIPVLFTSLFVCVVFAAASLSIIPWLILGFYAAASLVSYIAYAWDKSSAQMGKWRTAESTLHLIDLLGGWPGGLVAQRRLRHKSSKDEFLVVYWITALLNAAGLGYWVWTNFSLVSP